MTERFKYGKRYWYPHMKPADIAIWERFIAKHPDAYDECIYDLAVGSAPEFAAPEAAADLGNIAELYRRKIDVVGLKGGEVDIIELKPRAGTAALGQVVGYITLYKRDIDPSASPHPVLITDTLLPDMEMLAKTMGVKLIIV